MKHLIIGTAGHIDHGKTTLIRMLTGIDCDTHKEEKARGITINLGFSHILLPSGESAGIIDVPGHKDFINTMVGGACGIDMVLLVIAADSGIMPQTVEHINIITALGIDKGVVALTKTDIVDDELIEMAKYEISEYLKTTSLKNAPVIGVSAQTGAGKDELVNAIEQVIAQIEDRDKGNLFRMYIDRIFTVKGFGSVVTGSVLGGSIETGKEVFLLPGEKQKLRVRSIERHGAPVDAVIRGDRAAINLIGLKNDDFERGMLISNKKIDATEMIDGYITLFEDVPHLDVWTNVTFISGTFECQARMHLLNKDKLQGSEDAIVQLHLHKPANLVNKDKFIIRNSSADITFGGGYVIDASPLHHRKRTPQLIDALTSLCVNILTDSSTSENIGMVLKREFKPFTIDELAEKLNMRKDEVKAEISASPGQFVLYENAGNELFIAEKCEESFRGKIIKSLREHHHKNPIIADGFETGEILGKLGLSKVKCGKLYLELLLNKLQQTKELDKYKNTWIIAGHKPQFDAKTKEEILWLEQEIKNYSDGVPVHSEIEEKALLKGIPKQKIRLYIAFLSGEGKIRFSGGDYIWSEYLDQFRVNVLTALNKSENGIGIPEYKEIINGTKRLRAFLGEIFENEKVVRFIHGSDSETRIVITPKGKEFFDANLSR